jgi:hypothetical protein
MTDETNWQPIESAPQKVLVKTKIDDDKGARNEQDLIKDGNLWWTSDRAMYVYYTPTHWSAK